MRSVVALLLLCVVSTTRAQCNLNNDQEQLCINYCGLSVQCNNQCANKPQNQYVGCICQDVCLCAMEICQSCCLSAPPQFGQEFCRSNAGMNLAFCGDPLVRCSFRYNERGEGTDMRGGNRVRVGHRTTTAECTIRSFSQRRRSFLRALSLSSIIFPTRREWSCLTLHAPAAVGRHRRHQRP